MGFSTYGAMGYGLAMNGMPDNVHMTLTQIKIQELIA